VILKVQDLGDVVFHQLGRTIAMDKNYKIVEIPEKGRCLVASRALDPLEIILWDRPAVVAPHHDAPPSQCLECLGDPGGGRCPGCGAPLCQQDCSNSEQLHEEVECQLLSRLGEAGRHKVLGVLRLLMLRDQGGNVWQQIDQLMDHDAERRKNPGEWSMFQKEVVDVVKTVRPDVDDDLVHKLIGILNTNSVSFNFKKDSRKGRILYPCLSLASHSCVANARYTVNPEDFSVVLRARKRIEEGEEIAIHYVSPMMGLIKRKQSIEEEWYFKCRCPRCADVTEFGTYFSAMKCSHCHEGLILPETPDEDSLWRCRFCSNPFEANFIGHLVSELEEELQTLIRSSKTTVKNLEDFIKNNAKDLHTKHYLNLMAQRQILQLLANDTTVTREKAKKIIRLCKSFQLIMSRVDPGLSEWGGFISHLRNKAQLETLKMDFQDKKVNKNSFIEECEVVWEKMKEVGECEVLCTPVKFCDAR